MTLKLYQLIFKFIDAEANGLLLKFKFYSLFIVFPIIITTYFIECILYFFKVC